MISTLAVAAVLVSGFGWYQVYDWHRFIHQVQQDECHPEPKPGCGRRDQ